MSQSGVSVRTMSHKCESYESEWSKCERKKKEEKSPCVMWIVTLGICGFALICTGTEGLAAAVNFHLVPDSISHNFAIREHVGIESLAQTFAASQSFPEQVDCLVPQSWAVVWAADIHIPSVFWLKVRSFVADEATAFPFATTYLIQEFSVP